MKFKKALKKLIQKDGKGFIAKRETMDFAFAILKDNLVNEGVEKFIANGKFKGGIGLYGKEKEPRFFTLSYYGYAYMINSKSVQECNIDENEDDWFLYSYRELYTKLGNTPLCFGSNGFVRSQSDIDIDVYGY